MNLSVKTYWEGKMMFVDYFLRCFGWNVAVLSRYSPWMHFCCSRKYFCFDALPVFSPYIWYKTNLGFLKALNWYRRITNDTWDKHDQYPLSDYDRRIMCLKVTSRHTGHIQSWETHRPACHRLDRSKPSDFKFTTSNSTECYANLVACLICVTANCFCDNSWSWFVPRIHTGVDDFFGFRWTTSSFPCLGEREVDI